MLAEHHDVAADLWAAPGWKQLREDAIDVERWNRLHPTGEQRTPLVTARLNEAAGSAFVAVTDYIRAYPDMVSRWVPGSWVSLGTDGFGRSDTRAQMRRFFEVDARSVVVAVLAALVETGDAKEEELADAIARYEIDPDLPTPRVTP
jgi:pyruvate dehydrogenase E1 component